MLSNRRISLTHTSLPFTARHIGAIYFSPPTPYFIAPSAIRRGDEIAIWPSVAYHHRVDEGNTVVLSVPVPPPSLLIRGKKPVLSIRFRRDILHDPIIKSTSLRVGIRKRLRLEWQTVKRFPVVAATCPASRDKFPFNNPIRLKHVSPSFASDQNVRAHLLASDVCPDFRSTVTIVS